MPKDPKIVQHNTMLEKHGVPAERDDAQKPQWKQAEGRSETEKNLKPAKGDTLKDNKPDA